MARPRTPKGRARETAARLAVEYPGTAADLCALEHDNPFQLLVATILSAQCTDERVNLVTPALFKKYPSARELARARTPSLEKEIRSTGFFRAKSRSLAARRSGSTGTARSSSISPRWSGESTAR